MFKTLLICPILLCLAYPAQAADYLLYFEAQGIFGYSSQLNRAPYYSMNPDAEMQKPSLGFDYIKRFSGESGDIATLAVQGRLALIVDGDNYKLEAPIHNAYLTG